MNEEWRPIPGYEGHYEVSSLGQLKSLKYGKERILALGPKASDRTALLCMDGIRTSITCGQAVALAWHGPAPEGVTQIRHINRNPVDNRPENVEWNTGA